MKGSEKFQKAAQAINTMEHFANDSNNHLVRSWLPVLISHCLCLQGLDGMCRFTVYHPGVGWWWWGYCISLIKSQWLQTTKQRCQTLRLYLYTGAKASV